MCHRRAHRDAAVQSASGPSTPPTGGQTFTANNTRDQILVGGTGDDIFYTGHNSVVITGGGGGDRYVFQHAPWNNTGHITDFALGIDQLDFTVLFAAAGYTGSDPVADGYHPVRFGRRGRNARPVRCGWSGRQSVAVAHHHARSRRADRPDRHAALRFGEASDLRRQRQGKR